MGVQGAHAEKTVSSAREEEKDVAAMRPWSKKSLALGIAGLLLTVAGIAMRFLWPTFFHFLLQKNMYLAADSKSFPLWQDTTNLPPVYLDIYFFNWTNPDELLKPGKKPILVEIGPYSFREIRQKVNVVFHPENATVSYSQRRLWYFNAERSNGSLSDKVTQMNAVALSAKHKVRFRSKIMQGALSFLLDRTSKIHVVKSVDELLFTGYQDSVMEIGKSFAEAEGLPPFDRFGWFYTRNGSADFDGHFNMDTGEDDISKLGTLRKWNFRDTTKFHRSPCNIVEGSAGDFWPPCRTKDDITFFSADLCRPLVYEYESTVTHMGMKGYKYSLGDKSLSNSTEKRFPHEQAMYFEPTTTTEDFFEADYSSEVTDTPGEDPDIVNMGNCYCNGQCAPSGLINITSCRYGAPAFVSLPHFYKADPMLKDDVIGLNPTDKEHNFYITLEPTTAVPLEVAARLQVNLLLESSPTTTLFDGVPKIYFPMFWFSLKVSMPEQFATELKSLLLFSTIIGYVGIACLLLGVFIVSTIGLVYCTRRHRKSSPIEEQPAEKVTDPLPSAKSELLYLDKVSQNDDAHVRSDRRLYAKLY